MKYTPHTAFWCIIGVWIVYEVWRFGMFGYHESIGAATLVQSTCMVEVADYMVRELMYKCGWHGFGYIDTSLMEYGCRYHVVERMIEPDGSYSICVVNSFDSIRYAIDEVYFRIGYREDYAPEGWASDYEIWHVNEHRYYLYSSAYSFCEYFDVLPQWLYCVVDWDGTEIYSFCAEDWEDTAKLYGGGSVSGPTVRVKKLSYHDRLNGALNLEGYFPVITVSVL